MSLDEHIIMCACLQVGMDTETVNDIVGGNFFNFIFLYLALHELDGFNIL